MFYAQIMAKITLSKWLTDDHFICHRFSIEIIIIAQESNSNNNNNNNNSAYDSTVVLIKAYNVEGSIMQTICFGAQDLIRQTKIFALPNRNNLNDNL